MLIRKADPSDNERILAFQAQHAMRGKLPLRFDRTPDYFALHRCHSDQHEIWVAEDGLEEIKGVASLVVRNGYIGGRVRRIAYLGDLRLVPDRRLSREWTGVVRSRLEALRREQGVEHAFCCMIRDNAIAVQSLARSRRPDRLRFGHWHGYDNVSIYARRGFSRRQAAPDGIRIVEARPQHADALREFLDAMSREQALGCVFSEHEFERRLTAWPDFGLSSFLLAIDTRGALAGCVAPWDAGRIKRIVIERLPPSLQALRIGVNALASVLRRPPVAAPGEPLSDVYLTHLQVLNRNPAVFSALLDAAWSRVRSTHALMQLCLYENDPLWAAMQGFRYTRTPMDLYTLPTDAREVADPRTIDLELKGCLPGFEIYLV
ncbi:hypothetical protein [Paraburkholderia bannensis]|uniref:hypothetical protein n=1 Tax=Paraburkholderia bannensis TaxID=765414 RepID=UPI002AC34734|nr:hypothetical protein [Paraburkholderia bannensis]